MYLVMNKCVTAVKVSNFSDHYLGNRSTLDIGVLGYIGIVQHKEHSPEVLHIPPGTPCICMYSYFAPVRKLSSSFSLMGIIMNNWSYLCDNWCIDDSYNPVLCITVLVSLQLPIYNDANF